MPDSATQDHQVQSKRAKMRCPACAFLVTLPAETCPKCDTSLRDAYVKPQTEINWRGRVAISGTVLLFILGLAVFFFGWTGQGPARATSQDELNRTGLSEALDTVQHLADHPADDTSSPVEALDQAAEPADQR